jgi:alkylated DNA repair protein (DNA oxidative demethylase)
MTVSADPRQGGLFDPPIGDRELSPGAKVLGGLAQAEAPALLAQIAAIEAAAPFRHLTTPGGQRMSAAMTNCGDAGWVSDRRGYRYGADDPLSGAPWPAMPPLFLDLARRAAARAGFEGFSPDACLVNRYAPGARMGAHQDRDEAAMDQPIVSVSLGLPATFLWGGTQRGGRMTRLPLLHGDVVVWGGPSRLVFHGVEALKDGDHPLTGRLRYNLTFRRARPL